VSSRRDSFLDGLRAVSILRVISLHLMQRVEHPLLALFSFAMPGMPLMFFVSGALAARSLERDEPAVVRRFWKERARRIFLPFWAFALAIVATCALGQVFGTGARFDFDWSRAWLWIVPLAGPQASAAFDHFDWHLWFLSSLILMLASAPWLLRLHRRLPFAAPAAFLGAGIATQVFGLGVPGVVENTLLFGSAFLFGFGFADGRIQKLPRWVLIALFAVLASAGVAYYGLKAPGAMLHAVLLGLVLVGLAFVALWLAAREAMTRVFDMPWAQRAIRTVNARAYTLYLWGPIANEIGWYIVQPASTLAYVFDFALSLAILIGLVKLFGPVEDWAARRGVIRQLAPHRPVEMNRAA